ncbi:30S ribosomal protein S9 [Candidatus Saccharibacteria bacterium]|nr:30S ribosomal protein S9 [Candidatus Saccharibacteria bacterium]MCB9821530.1 30S ribosomal protein S9 [Candidatus Nomurabacteria bacterium]
MAKDTYFYATGRRKSSTARVRVMSGKGSIVVNDLPASQYFAESELLLKELSLPFKVLDKADQFDVTVKVSGGGHHGQAESIKLGIAMALASMNEDQKSTLRRADLLGRDPRAKERKKFGLKGARKQRQFTKR